MAILRDHGSVDGARILSERFSKTADDGRQDDSALASEGIRASGLDDSIWSPVAQELAESNRLFAMSCGGTLIPSSRENAPASAFAGRATTSLVTDLAVTTASFGFSRCSREPGACHLNAFPADQRLGGRKPIFVDTVQADAVVIRLDPLAVLDWLRANGHSPSLPGGEDLASTQRAYFVRLFHGVQLRRSLTTDAPEVRQVFGLLHTLSHLAVRQASLLCGLERNSLSEYLLPRSLTFAVYANHRFGATIGALVSLYEQALEPWLAGITDSRMCVYDPVCAERGATCHACTHLAETSCGWYNLNLSRVYAFGGQDPVLGGRLRGFLE